MSVPLAKHLKYEPVDEELVPISSDQARYALQRSFSIFSEAMSCSQLFCGHSLLTHT
jgi:hypothetical protein